MTRNKPIPRITLITIVIISFIALSSESQAQQLPLYSQYNFNKFLINPANAGYNGYTSINLVAREQWAGFEGAPRTHAITIDSRILPNSYIEKDAPVRKKKRMSSRSGRVGWAAHLFNDHTGLLDRTGLEGTYSYHLSFADAQLSFGLSGMLYEFRLNRGEVVLSGDDYDPLLDDFNGKSYIPDASLGAFYTTTKFHAGLSAQHLLQSSVQIGDRIEDYRLYRNYNVTAGYVMYLGEKVSVEPSFLLRLPERSKPQLDINTDISFNEKFWAGLSYRTGNAMIVYLGAMFDRYFIGYAFDYNINPLMSHTYGSHEFMAAARFGTNARRYRWLKAF